MFCLFLCLAEQTNRTTFENVSNMIVKPLRNLHKNNFDLSRLGVRFVLTPRHSCVCVYAAG